MKPNFALNITDQSIGLLHRTSRGWLEVGTVRLDEADLGQALGYLRGSALGLEPRGLATKIVIPASQLRYMTLAAPGPDAAARRAQIRAELEGRTPYAVDELVFDWSGTGETVQVAVVARETLDEAEAFACEHRLNPLSFVAIPEPGQFAKEPWFGATAFAATMMQPGEKVERDQDPIQIVARVPLVREPVVAEPAAQPEPEIDVEPVRADIPKPPEESPAVSVEADALPPTEAEPVDPVVETVLADKPADALVVADAAEPAAVSAPPFEMPVVEAADVEAPFIEVESEPTVTPVRVAAASAGVTDPVIAEPPPAPAPLPRVDAAGPRPERTDASTPAAVSLVAEARGGKKPPPKSQTKPPPRPVDPPVKRPPISAQPRAVPNGAASGEGDWPLDRVTAARTAARAETGKAAPVITATTIPMPRDRKSGPVRTVPDAGPERVVPLPPRQTADAPLRSFGSKDVRQRGKPRYLGLILVALLLLLLAGVAAWSSLYLAGRSDDAVEVASALPDAAATLTQGGDVAMAAVDVPVADEASVAGVAAPDEQVTANLPADELSAPDPVAPVEAAVEETAVAAVAAVPVSPPNDAPAPEPDAATTGAAAPEPATIALPGTDVAASRTPTADVQDEIFLARVDPRISTSDVAALTAPAGLTDPAPASQPEPPPFGTVYQFDAEGRIVPTPEGIVTPQGVRLVAGRPPLVPPERPPVTSATPVAVDAVAPVAGASTAAPDLPVETPTAEVFADPALAGARPRARPAGLVAEPPAAPTVEEDAGLSVADNTRFSSLRPRARPPELLARGIAEAEAVDAAVQSASASLAAGVDATGSGSLLAVAVSRKPAPRPDDLNRSIEAAVSVAAAQASLVPDSPVIVVEPEVVEDPVVAEIDEPELAAAAPDVPIRASVAKQATFTRAINLSKVNLIGVYGTSSNRYAMVRQANGRFVKVGVGDRVDGGRVAAISDRTLQYVKNGRTHTLEIPRG